MVKRDVEVNKDDAIESEKDKKSVRMPLMRNRRAIRMLHGSIGKLSPLSVTDAANYDEQKNKGWVKPLFSSIVYRLPVSSELWELLSFIAIIAIENVEIFLTIRSDREMKCDFRISKRRSSCCYCW